MGQTEPSPVNQIPAQTSVHRKCVSEPLHAINQIPAQTSVHGKCVSEPLHARKEEERRGKKRKEEEIWKRKEERRGDLEERRGKKKKEEEISTEESDSTSSIRSVKSKQVAKSGGTGGPTYNYPKVNFCSHETGAATLNAVDARLRQLCDAKALPKKFYVMAVDFLLQNSLVCSWVSRLDDSEIAEWLWFRVSQSMPDELPQISSWIAGNFD